MTFAFCYSQRLKAERIRVKAVKQREEKTKK